MTHSRIACSRILQATVTARTTWLFVELGFDSGAKGVGEATLDGHADVVSRHLSELCTSFVSASLTAHDMLAALPDPQGNLSTAAAVSALDHALNDCLARERHMSVAAHLGGQKRSRIGLYANINRRTRDRSPAGFAASARDALTAGFRHIKIAPFDEVTCDMDAQDPLGLIDRGMERIAAVRGAMGKDGRLMVDCHWRFTPATAASLIDACAGLGVHWIECPLPEHPSLIPDLTDLRAKANSRDILLAGAENVIGLEGIEPFLEASAYDVMMPDVKYIGGLGMMMRIAERLEARGVLFSPHNPSGPVAHAASAEICAAAASVDLLEYQFEESPLFDDLVAEPMERTEGALELRRDRLGLGADLRDEILNGTGFVREFMVEEPNAFGIA